MIPWRRDSGDRPESGSDAQQERLERFQTVFENLPAIALIVDEDGRCLDINPPFAEALGSTPKDIQGRLLSDLAVPEFRIAARRLMADLNAGKDIYGDLLLRKEDGSELRIEYHAIGGVAAGAHLITAHDISGREEIERKLSDSLSMFRATLEASAEGVLVVDNDGNITAINERFREMSDISEEDFSASQVERRRRIMAEKTLDPESFVRRWKEIMADREAEAFDTVEFADGRVYERHSRPQRLAGRVVGRVWSYRDVTERVRAGEALRRAVHQREMILKSTGEGIFGMDARGYITFANASAAEMLGWRPEEMIGKLAHELLHHHRLDGTPYPASECPTLEVLRTGVRVSVEEDVYWKHDGSPLPVEFITAPIIEGSQISGAVAAFFDITERKQAQEESERSLSLLRATLEATADGILALSVDGKILTYNSRFAEMWGLPRDALVGTDRESVTVTAADKVKDPEAFMARARELAGDMTTDAFDIIEFKDGRIFERHSRPQIVNRVAVGRVYNFRDVTERVEAERALRASEERYAALFENHHATMLLIDPATGEIIDANPAACEYYGYGRNRLKQMKITDINMLSPEQVLQEMERAVHQDRREFHFPHKLASGEIRDVEVYSGPIEVGGRELLYSIIHDVTERKQVERAVLEREEKYRKLVESANDAIFIADAETGFILEANHKAEVLLDIPAKELIGMHQSQLHPTEDDTDYAKAFQIQTAAGAGVAQNMYVRRRDGTVVPVEISSSTFDFGGRRVVQGIFRDVTERRQAEERVARLAEEAQLLLEVSEIITGTLETDKIISRLVSIASDLTGLGRCSVLLKTDDGKLRFAASTDKSLLTDAQQGDADMLHDHMTAIRDVRVDLKESLPHPPEDMISALLVPMCLSGSCLGAMLLDEPGRSVEFTPRHERMAEAIGRQAAVAIQNAQAYGLQAGIAATLQESMLPEPTSGLDGLAIGLKYVSATKGAQVGGDFFDYFRLPDGRIAIFIGDVSGKGLAAAIDTATVKYAVKALATVDAEPGRLMQNLNKAVMPQLKRGRFVTMLYLVFDPDRGDIVYSSAGHWPPAIRRSTGEAHIEPVGEFTGVALGILDKAAYSQRRFRFEPGDTIVLYTDGLTEARSAVDRTEMYGDKRIQSLLASPGDRQVDEWVQALWNDVQVFTDNQLSDDMAILALRAR